MISVRENYLRTLEFRNPEWIHCDLEISPLTWTTHREKLEKVMVKYPKLFRGFTPGNRDFDAFPPTYRKDEHFRDNWDCVWYNKIDGIEGTVVGHPLDSWEAFDTYKMPDPDYFCERGELNWAEIRKDIEKDRKLGRLTKGDGERLFDRLYLLRGFENLMIDIGLDDPMLPRLVDSLLEHELKLVKKYLDIGVDIIGFHSDIGTQESLMINPEKFRKYIKPMFREVFQTCRKAGAHVYFSSDGNLLSIIDDLIECGISMHDPQLGAAKLEGIEQHYKGKVCIRLDLDRQMFGFSKPEDLRSQVEECIDKLYTPEGGLMLLASISDDITPLENIEALCEAMQDLCLGNASST